MSIYGGFSTRNQENKYYIILQDLLSLMETGLCRFLLQQQIDQLKFKNHFQKIYKNLVELQTQKYLQPKFSTAIASLARICQSIGNPINFTLHETNKKLQNRTITSGRSQQLQKSPNNINFFPVSNIYNMKWGRQSKSKELNIIGQQGSEYQDQSSYRPNKRIKSGVSYKKKFSVSGENVRPNTSIKRKQVQPNHNSFQKIQDQKSLTNQFRSYRNKSNTIILAQEKKLSATRLSHPKKQLYYDLQKKYGSTLQVPNTEYSQKLLIKFPIRKKSYRGADRMYKIAKLF